MSEEKVPGQVPLPPLPPKWTGRFRKLPVVIEAVQLTRENAAEVWQWVAPAVKAGRAVDVIIDIDEGLTVSTLEGDMRAPFGWWVIRGVKGEFYPCADDVFRETYEPVDGPDSGDTERRSAEYERYAYGKPGMNL